MFIYLGHKNTAAARRELSKVGFLIICSMALNGSSGLLIVSTSNPKITEPITFNEYLK